MVVGMQNPEHISLGLAEGPWSSAEVPGGFATPYQWALGRQSGTLLTEISFEHFAFFLDSLL